MQIGPYEVLGELGRGGMGTVYRARRADLDRDFALKVITPGAGLTPVQVARFEREARAAGALSATAGIVSVHDIGVADDGTLYLAMDLIEGRPLDEIVADEPLPPRNVAVTGAQIARAVQAAHDRGVLHRDIKPANVLVDRSGAPFLADFGLAAAEQLDQQATRLTKSGEIFGTPAYMPPEQARGEAVDGTADVYALGATLYEMAAGGPPFACDSTFATLMEVLHSPPPMAPLRRAGVPRDLQTVIATCLAKSPGDRYPTPQALAADLDRFAAGEPVLARPVGGATRFWRAARRRPALMAGTGVVALAAIGGGGAAWWYANQSAADSTQRGVVQAEQTEVDRTTQLVGLWATLHREGLADLRTCEDAWRGRPFEAGVVDDALARTQALCAAHQSDDVRLPQAWYALAALYAGEPESARAALDALAQDPNAGALSKLFVARGYLALWTAAIELPSVQVDSTGLVAGSWNESEVLQGYRRRAEEVLADVEGDRIWELVDGGAEIRDYLAAVVLFTRGEHRNAGEALRALRDAPAVNGEAALLGGLSRFLVGQFEESVVVVSPAVDRSWPVAFEVAAMANLTLATKYQREPEKARLALDAAVNLGRNLAGLQPTNARARQMYALFLRHRGDLLIGTGRDPQPDYLDALARLNEAAELEAPTSGLRRDRAQTLLVLAQGRVQHGEDPMPEALAAAEDARGCVTTNANDRLAWLTLGSALALVAERRHVRGLPAEDDFSEALVAMNRAIDLEPDVLSLSRRAGILRQRGDARAGRGADALPDLRAAARDYDAALVGAPNLVEALAGRALTHWSLADNLPDPADAVAELRAGIAVAGRALDEAPDHHAMHETRGSLRYTLAQFEIRARRDGEPLLEAALHDLNRALEINPGSLAGRVIRANIHAVRAEYAQMQGRDPIPHYEAALADFSAGLQRAPNNIDALYNRAVLFMSLGDARKRRGEDSAQAYRAAVADFGRCTQIAPQMWQSHAGRGAGFEALGQGGEALQAFETAAKLNPRDAGVRRAVARLRAQQPLRNGSK